MAKLSPKERADLPDSAFAYIDGKGKRRLPINDEAHVRNALGRFDRVAFEDDGARERARIRLLNAAKKFGIVPVGFITGQLRSEGRHAAAGRVVIEMGRLGAASDLEPQLRSALRDPSLAVLTWSDAAGGYLDAVGAPVPLPEEHAGRAVTYLERQGRPMAAVVHDPAVLADPALAETVLSAVRYVIEKERLLGEVQARSADVATLPTGFVTFLLTDIEGSTALLRQLGDGYAGLLNDVRTIIRQHVLQAGGREVDARADEFFAVFEQVSDAMRAAVALQLDLGRHSWPDQVQCRVRIGLHSGRPTLTDTGYIGLSVHTAARISYAGHGAQIVASEETRTAVGDSLPEGVTLRPLGRFRLRGLPEPQTLYQVDADGLVDDFPPPRTDRASADAGAWQPSHQ
jgi:class 3 adenylate cyclase